MRHFIIFYSLFALLLIGCSQTDRVNLKQKQAAISVPPKAVGTDNPYYKNIYVSELSGFTSTGFFDKRVLTVSDSGMRALVKQQLEAAELFNPVGHYHLVIYSFA
jgi:hypothetical protein